MEHGYSGKNELLNKPEDECLKEDIGPIPSNIYKIILCKNTMHNPPVIR
jgi:hypothetical protein